ncbi:hypothetical protein [Corallococcus aberystwythensis]|nr:hypothetical protein [Corallococcus aberystwythensis]
MPLRASRMLTDLLRSFYPLLRQARKAPAPAPGRKPRRRSV